MRTRKTPQSRTSSPLTPKFSSHQKSAKRSFEKIYKQGTVTLNSSKKSPHGTKKFSMAVVGVALGDEGKGRLVDNAITQLLKEKKVKKISVVRFQGGNNAGHTVEKGKIKLALHLIPSGVLHKKAVNIIDRGVIVNVEDLRTEVEYVEKHAGSLAKRLFVSMDALLCTDLERAEELLNRQKDTNATGGTGRGIAPTYAHHYDKTGLKLFDLMHNSWEKRLGDYYDQYKKLFTGFGLQIESIETPDYKETLKTSTASTRPLGTKTTFLNRLRAARTWLIKRNIVTNTYLHHQTIADDPSHAILFEGAQAHGLDAWLGTLPDVTASNTSVYGVREGTAFWRAEDIDQKIGVFKIPYTSSVGSRSMPTHIKLPSKSPHISGEGQGEVLNKDQKWGLWVRETAHEYGTTTGRPRDITFLDLPFLTYNLKMSGVNSLIGTHLDTAREEDVIKLCTHYEDTKGNMVPYQPGLHHLKNVTPRYIELPGWDGSKCQKAKLKRDLPKKAIQFLSFLESQFKIPIIAATTGPDRKHIVYF